MKKMLATCLMLISLIQFSSCCAVEWQKFFSTRGVGLGGYWEVSKKYYPNAVQFFDDMKQKYPDLKPVSILILQGPMADEDTIYFPMAWIEELQKGNKFYRQATEWIILHEVGHIMHNDMTKRTISLLAIWGGYFAMNQELNNSNYDTIRTVKKMCLTSMCVGLAGLLYSMATAEYLADDYAMQHCDNPEAWIAAYEFLERYAPLGFLPGLFHSFTTFRLSRIAKGFNEKFGYELEVVPQSLSPVYDEFE